MYRALPRIFSISVLDLGPYIAPWALSAPSLKCFAPALPTRLSANQRIYSFLVALRFLDLGQAYRQVGSREDENAFSSSSSQSPLKGYVIQKIMLEKTCFFPLFLLSTLSLEIGTYLSLLPDFPLKNVNPKKTEAWLIGFPAVPHSQTYSVYSFPHLS